MRKTIEIPFTHNEKDITISFSRVQVIEISISNIEDNFPEIQDDDIEKFKEWAEKIATFAHTTEPEYEFSIYQGEDWIKHLQVPEKFIPVFQAAQLAAKEIQDIEKRDVFLKIFA